VELQPPPWPAAPDDALLRTAIATWARACPRPLVLFFDEIDALRGKALISVLRQLRAGFGDRPAGFPASVALCGLRDVRDYKAASGGDPDRLGTASPFNIKVASLRVGDFTAEEVRELYTQHTADTGQAFTAEAQEAAFALTAGQPWLVNALAREVVEEMGVPATESITAAHLDEAKERLILARVTHLDSLAARLAEPRVRKVIAPLLAGTVDVAADAFHDDVQYVRDLGLVARDNPVRIANPIYREVIVRVLSSGAEGTVTADPHAFVLPDGRLDMQQLLGEFAAFWSEHGEALVGHMPYHEVAPQLVLMAFLQRIVNGGGFIDREYGVGRGRIDLCLRWPYVDSEGRRAVQREALELKVWRDGQVDPLEKALRQLDGYLAQLGLHRGVLVVFDRRTVALLVPDRTRFEEAASPSGRAITVLRA
jgi:hypothetical protein